MKIQDKRHRLSNFIEERLTRKRGSIQQTIFFLSSIIVSVSIFAYLLSTVSLKEITDILKKISMRGFTVFILFSFSMSFFRTWRYTLLLNNSGFRVNSIAMYLITVIRNFFSDLLPARLGTLIYIYLVRTRLGVSFGPATASFALSFVFDILALAFLIALSALLVSSAYLSQHLLFFSGILLAFGSIMVLFFLPSFFVFFAKMVSLLKFISVKYRNNWQQALDSIREDLLKARRVNIYFKVLALSLAVRCFKYLSLYILLLALIVPAGYQAASFPLPKVFLGLCSAEFAASLPISGLAGFGAYEGAWSLVFQLLGYPEKFAVVTSIAHHLVTQVYGYSLGAIALLLLLLPIFGKKFNRISPQHRISNISFAIRFITLFCLPIILGFIFIFSTGFLQYNNYSLFTTEKQPSFEDISRHEKTTKIVRGWIVYERPDGIYKAETVSKKYKHLIGYGTYPRWSRDGKMIVFVNNNDVMIMDSEGKKVKRIAAAKKSRAVCFHPSGKSIFYTDGNEIRQVNISDGLINTVMSGSKFREIDISDNGQKLVTTAKTHFGFNVMAFDIKTKTVRTVAKGCSASISPDGRFITVNGSNHKLLNIYSWDSLKQVGAISAPLGYKFDNQFWSNHPDWIVSKSEGDSENIFIHQVSSDKSFQITYQSNCDRPDLLVLP